MLEVSKLTAKNKEGISVLNQLNLNVRAGEIVGIAGVDGNGQSELIEALTGLRKVESGSILLEGKEPVQSFSAPYLGVGCSPHSGRSP